MASNNTPCDCVGVREWSIADTTVVVQGADILEFWQMHVGISRSDDVVKNCSGATLPKQAGETNDELTRGQNFVMLQSK
jgi:hypothetical protein